MRPAVVLGAFGVVLAAAFGGGATAGSLAGPIDTAGGGDHGGDPADEAPIELPAGGLLVAQDGLHLEPADRLADAGPFRFRIVDAGGSAVTDFVEQHEREMHLIVAARDLQTFHHIHPHMDAAGDWQVDLPALPAGSYRAFADFQADGFVPMTLGVDLVAPGSAEAPRPLTTSRTDATDGYDVDIDGTLDAGGSSELTITVQRDAEVVTTEPYLGAGGHLVALRDGDLAFLHVHPLADDTTGPVRFAVEVPSAGTYALFFDFAHAGEVHTARFVLDARSVEPGAPSDTPDQHDEGH
ncbi:MAG TPA: heavy-metal-associated domain-containing protein [Acidimicrobiales bacterium]|nr:heavy-metal-associated domain-containing protein [Acidimicrobiales bacterium]